MTDQPKRRRWKRRALVMLVLVMLLPLWYVLSAGPVWWLASHGYVSNDLALKVNAFYRPAFRLADSWPLFGDLWAAYAKFWIR